jgi:hypothetical protein
MDHGELNNPRVHAIARAHDCTVDQVNAALDRHPIELDRDRYLKRTLALELMRLDQLEMAFEGKAIRDRDVAAGALMVKIAERRATLLGLNPPLGHAVQVIQHEPVEKKTSTEKLRGVLDNILQISARERFLLDKEAEIGGPGITPEESAEIDELRKARGKGPRAQDPRG